MSVVGTAQLYADGHSASSGIVGSGLTVRQVDEFTVTYLVTTNDNDDGPDVALSATGLPALGDPYDTGENSEALVKSLRPRRDSESPKKWLVEVVYSTDTGDVSRVEKNPLNRLPDVVWSTSRQQKTVDRDLSIVLNQTDFNEGNFFVGMEISVAFGRPIVNTAGEKFDPPIQIDDSRITLSVSRNLAAFDPATVCIYKDALNLDAFQGFLPGCWKVGRINAQTQFEQDIAYWRVTVEFELNTDGWQPAILDAGLNACKSGVAGLAGGVDAIIDDKGARITQSVPLNGDGQPLYKIGSFPGANTTLAADLLISENTMVVASQANFPTLQDPTQPPPPSMFPPIYAFLVNVENELILVTSRIDAATYKVVRGIPGSMLVVGQGAVAKHTSGTTVQMLPIFLRYQCYRIMPYQPLAALMGIG